MRSCSTVILLGCLGMSAICQAQTMFNDVTVNDVIAEAETPAPSIWTYDDCVNRAIEKNPDIRRTLLGILQAEQNVASAKDAYLPSVDFSTNHNFSNYPSPDEGRKANGYTSSYGINASWTVWEGNVRKYQLESSKLLNRIQELTGEDLVKELKLSILQAYLNILYSHEAIEIARQSLEVSTQQTARARRFTEAGKTSPVELAQIESQQAQDEYNVVQAESNLASYKMTMKKLLALGLDAEFEIDRTSFPDDEVNSLLPPIETTFASATAWLPEFKSNELNKSVYSNDIKAAKAGRLPNLSLQGGVGTGYASGGKSWGSQMGHGFNEYVGLSLSVPIFDANKTKRAVAKANLAALEYDVTRDQLIDDLTQTIENLYIDARNARAKYQSGVTRLKATEQTAKLVDRQFELGMVNPLELLTAHNDLRTARLEQLQNKYMAILSSKTIEFYNSQKISIP